METKTSATQAHQTVNQPFFIEPRAIVSDDGEYLTLVLPGGGRIRRHRHYFLHLLGIPYVRKGAVKPAAAAVGQ